VNYDQPRELADHSGWHYTSMNDGRVHAIGYCANHDPHPTKDEAYDCYTRYKLDHDLRLDGQWQDTWHRCLIEGCETLTDRHAWFAPWGPTYNLCDEHRTREVVAELFGTVGDSIHS
jgi:hypothetical protein